MVEEHAPLSIPSGPRARHSIHHRVFRLQPDLSMLTETLQCQGLVCIWPDDPLCGIMMYRKLY